MRVALNIPPQTTSLADFAKIFVAVIARGHVPVLLPNLQPGTFEAFASEYDLIVGADSKEIVNETHTLRDLNLASPVVMFTSGSTGKPKKIVKELSHFLNEIEVIESLFGRDQIEAIHSTVSSTHIYGLLFAILWPLTTGREVGSFISFPEELQILDKAKKKYALISSPAFLKRIDTSLPQTIFCSRVVSSGGVLDFSSAQKTNTFSGRWPTEIYGSSETGGIAWRARDELHHEPEWQALPGVKISLEEETGCLVVRSPFFSENEIVMGDRAEFSEKLSFRLLGRIDRIVKIEGKRVSLDEIESKLQEHSWISEAVALNQSVPFGSSYRDQINCIVVLSELGRAQLNARDESRLKNELKNYLSPFFDAIVLPRKWRFVSELPRNAQNKIEISNVEGLFHAAP